MEQDEERKARHRRAIYAMGTSLALVMKYTEKVNAGDCRDGFVTGRHSSHGVETIEHVNYDVTLTEEYGSLGGGGRGITSSAREAQPKI